MARRPPLDDAPTVDIGPYRLAHRIAVGGMAEVFRALWPQAAGGDRSVVIKRLRAELVDDHELRTMFEDEVRLGSRIDHTNVVSVLDHGLDDGTPYMVLEYVFGVDLWRLVRWMRTVGRGVSVSTSVWIVVQLLDGLEAVHRLRDERGGLMYVVHRDVSPSNVFLSVHGDVKLGDLGIAKATLRSREDDRGASAKGKLGYLSPEQVDGEDVDPRSDVFSAGVILAELLTGRQLFNGATEIAVLLAIRDADIGVFEEIAERLPDGLADVVRSALARRPDERAESAATLRAALTPFVTTPEDDCRAELGALVVGGLDAQTTAASRTALKKTVESSAFEREHRYAVERGGQPVGDYRLADLVKGVTIGEIEPTDHVRRDGGTDRIVEQIPEIAGYIPSSRRTPSARRMTQLGQTAERWDLSTRSIVSVLGELLEAREDGLLLCQRGHIRKEVYLDRGAPRFVTSNQPGELLGEALVHQGVLTTDQLDLALAALPRFKGRLGEALVGTNLLHPVDVMHHLNEHARQRLLALFEWSEGQASLYKDLERPQRAFRLDVDPWVILLRGLARRLDAIGPGRDAARADGFVTRDRPLAEDAPDALRALWEPCVAPTAIASLEPLAATPEQARLRVALLVELGALLWHATAEEA